MFRFTIDGDRIARTDIFSDAFFSINVFSQLIIIGNLKVGPDAKGSFLGLKGAEQNLEQGCFTAAIRPNQSDLIAAHNLR